MKKDKNNPLDPNSTVPMELPAVKPGEYDGSVDIGSTDVGEGQQVKPETKKDPARQKEQEIHKMAL